MAVTDGFLAIRYYPVDGETDTGEFSGFNDNGCAIGIGTWLRDYPVANPRVPTMVDENNIDSGIDVFHYYDTWSLASQSVVELPTAGLNRDEYSEKLVRLIGEDGLPVGSLEDAGDQFDVIVAGLGIEYSYDVANDVWISEDDSVPAVNALGVVDIGVYEGGAFRSLAAFRIQGYHRRQVDGCWDNPNLPAFKNLWEDTQRGVIYATLKGEAREWPEPGIDPRDMDGFSIRFWPVSDAGADYYPDPMDYWIYWHVSLGISVWALGGSHGSSSKTMVSLGDAAEEVPSYIYYVGDNWWDDLSITSFWASDETVAEGTYFEYRIGMTKPGSGELIDFDIESGLPLEVYVGGLGYGHIHDETDNSWVANEYPNNQSAGVVEIGYYQNREYYQLTVFRMKGEYFEERAGGSWNHPDLPNPTNTLWLEDGTGILKATLTRESGPVDGGFWTAFINTEEIV